MKTFGGRVIVLPTLALLFTMLFAAPSQAADVQSPSPAGANVTCRPSKAHPRPVVLVHGTHSTMAGTWSSLSPLLKRTGYCVYALNFGEQGTISISQSAAQIAAFVTKVRAATGATKVDMIGHSQGGLVGRYYIRFLSGSKYVNDLIGIGTPNHGTTVNLGNCDACQEMTYNGPFIRHLNSPSPATAVFYTQIMTSTDDYIHPYTSTALGGPVSKVVNVTLQTRCPSHRVGHLAMPQDPLVAQWVSNALARIGPANPTLKPRC